MSKEEDEVSHRLERLRDLTDQLDSFSEIAAVQLDALPSLVCIWKRNRIYFANKAFTEILGYEKDEILEQRWRDFIHPDDLNATVNIVGRGDPIVAFRNRWVAKDGTPVPIEWASTAPSPQGFSLAIGTPLEGQSGTE